MKKKPKKDFDCVEMKREIQDKMYREMMNMSRDEQLAYIKKVAAQSKSAKVRS